MANVVRHLPNAVMDRLATRATVWMMIVTVRSMRPAIAVDVCSSLVTAGFQSTLGRAPAWVVSPIALMDGSTSARVKSYPRTNNAAMVSIRTVMALSMKVARSMIASRPRKSVMKSTMTATDKRMRSSAALVVAVTRAPMKSAEMDWITTAMVVWKRFVGA